MPDSWGQWGAAHVYTPSENNLSIEDEQDDGKVMIKLMV